MEPLNLKNIQNSMQTGHVTRPQETRPTPDDAAAKTGRNAEETSRTQRADDTAAKGVYGDVLDISEDGDTITARPEAMQALDDGYVILKNGSEDDEEAQEEATVAISSDDEPSVSEQALERMKEQEAARAEERKEARLEARAEEQEQDTAQSTSDTGSLNGYSDEMIDTLYRQGRIDSGDYRSEMDRRSRLDEMTSDEDDTAAQETTDRLNQNAQQLGRLNAEEDRNELENEAYQTAIENGRVNLVKDIFADDSAQ